MKLFHLSDLHIGKYLDTYDIKDVQKDIFAQIIDAVEAEKPDAIVIAGDIYDKSAPSGEAFDLFNDLLNELATLSYEVPVMIISGNHDNNLRLNFASSFLEKNNIYISATLPANEEEFLKKVVLSDDHGEVDFYLLPFTKPVDAKNLFKDKKEIRTYDDAVAAMIERENIDYSRRNVLVAHQFFVDSGKEPVRCDSEMKYISVGGLDSVDTSHVEDFDYVALGHIHSSQAIGKSHIRYSGTPVKYSVSEADHNKSITVVELGAKGCEPVVSFIPLKMKYDVKKLRGTLEEIIAMANDELKNDYVSITLTDEENPFNPKERLMEYYDRILGITVDNERTKARLKEDYEADEDADMFTLFSEFYQEINGQPLSEAEIAFVNEVIGEVSENIM